MRRENWPAGSPLPPTSIAIAPQRNALPRRHRHARLAALERDADSRGQIAQKLGPSALQILPVLGEALEIVRAHVDGIRAGSAEAPVVAARLRLHRRNELARDLRGLQVARKRLREGALDEASRRTARSSRRSSRRAARGARYRSRRGPRLPGGTSTSPSRGQQRAYAAGYQAALEVLSRQKPVDHFRRLAWIGRTDRIDERAARVARDGPIRSSSARCVSARRSPSVACFFQRASGCRPTTPDARSTARRAARGRSAGRASSDSAVASPVTTRRGDAGLLEPAVERRGFARVALDAEQRALVRPAARRFAVPCCRARCTRRGSPRRAAGRARRRPSPSSPTAGHHAPSLAPSGTPRRVPTSSASATSAERARLDSRSARAAAALRPRVALSALTTIAAARRFVHRRADRFDAASPKTSRHWRTSHVGSE